MSKDIETGLFREPLGQYPTGAAVRTRIAPDEGPLPTALRITGPRLSVDTVQGGTCIAVLQRFPSKVELAGDARA